MGRIPTAFEGVAKSAALRSWVRSRKCPLERYFEEIDFLQERFARYTPEGEQEPRPEALRAALGGFVYENDLLLNHVRDDTQYDLDTSGAMWKVCEAAAALILLEYEKAVKDGKWPKS